MKDPSPRCSSFGAINHLVTATDTQFSQELFRRLCICRYFELELIETYEKKIIPSTIYLSTGQEATPVALSMVLKDFAIFGQHRCHSLYLAFGGDPIRLIDELLGRKTGCNGGKGGSAFIKDLSINMYPHNSMMGENVCFAVGYSLGKGKKSLAVFGDAAAEEDYVFGALGYAVTKKIPVLFVCEDNDLAILTPTAERRSWQIKDIAEALGMPAVDISDDPWLIAHHAKEFKQRLPALINIRTCRLHWHAGSGMDGSPQWDRFSLVKNKLYEIGIDCDSIELKVKEDIKNLWKCQLEKP